MYLFNSQCQIQKYNSAIDIIKYFYNIRITYIERRKQYILNQLLNEINIKENKIRFIKENIEGIIKVSELTKNELELVLENTNYDRNNDKFNYLIDIPIYKMTKDEVKQFKNDIEKSRQLYDEIKDKTIQEMWLEDLNKFEILYDKYVNTRLEKYNEIIVKKSKKKN